MEHPVLLLFLGGMGGSPVEEMVAGTQRAVAQDIRERARASKAFEQIILATDDKGIEVSPGEVVDYDPQPFHFGKRLYQLIEKYRLNRPFYLGGGSAPLLSAQQLGAMARQLSTSTNTVITNNFYSSDLVAFTPGEAIEKVALPVRDNPLARLLVEQGGLSLTSLPRQAATLFDIDSPADLLVLLLHAGAGPHTRAYLQTLGLDTSRLTRAISFFSQPDAEIVVAGRAGSYLWSKMEQETACRVRFISEERGLSADGREEQRKGRSLMGFYLEEVGPERFFHRLAELGDAAFLDSRVLFHHLRLEVSRKDRFLSDLGLIEEIDDPYVRRFTRAALEAPIPVILGGHSLVSGGLLVLLEISPARNAPASGDSRKDKDAL